MTTIFVFPGHGSHRVGMGEGLFDRYPHLVAEADSVLGYSISQLCLEGPSTRLADNRFTQPAMYVMGALSYLDHLANTGRHPDMVAGHSLGEYTALFAAGVFDFRTGLELVDRRAELMTATGSGGMVAVIDLSLPAIQAVLDREGLTSIDVASLNSPDQTALSGPLDDLRRAATALSAEATAVFWLSQTNAPHSRYLRPAAAEFADFLTGYRFAAPTVPVVANATARPYRPGQVAELLVRQFTEPVRWTDTVRYLASQPEPEFVEIGPGTVLTGLIRTILDDPTADPVRPDVRVDERDIALFAAASRDTNPLHVDEAYARRTPFGVPIAHGVLGALLALSAVPAQPGRRVRQVRARFMAPLFAGQTYQRAVDVNGADSVRVRLTAGARPVLEVDAAFEDGPVATVAVPGGDDPPPSTTGPATLPVAALSWDELAARPRVASAYQPDWAQLAVLVDRLGLAGRGIGVPEAATLAWTSYLTGMRLPGRDALLRDVTVEFRREPVEPPAVRDDVLDTRARVVDADERFRLVRVEGETALGELRARAAITATCRATPVDPSADLVARSSPPGAPLDTRVALVIGGSRGLGAALVMALAQQGCTVYAGYHRSTAEAERVRAAGAGRVRLLPGDAADPQWCRAARDRIVAAEGRLDVLVLNACPPINPLALDEAGYQDLHGYVSRSLALAGTPLAVLGGTVAQHGGTVVTISSAEVAHPVPGRPHYVTAKHAVEGLTRAAAREHPGGRFLIVRPPHLLTTLTDTTAAEVPPVRPEPVAVAVVRELVAGPAPGQVAVVESFPETAAEPAPEVRSDRAALVVAATFTAEPIGAALEYWNELLDLELDIRFAGHGQVFQELLDPGSGFAGNRDGVNAVLLRPEDWLAEPGGDIDWAALRRTAAEFVQAVDAFAGRDGAPVLVCLCPPSPAMTVHKGRSLAWAELEDGLRAQLAAIAGVTVLTPTSWEGAYPFGAHHDGARTELARIPYTPQAFSTLGTLLMRGVHALVRPPYKVLVLDCDNTLWHGVVGEDGAAGVEVRPWHAYLQRYAVALQERGVMVCVCSKNTEADVLDVFQSRPEMRLRLEHLAGHRINWQPKSDNIAALADELGVGIDSVLFLDDNPAEVAEVRAALPEVVALALPADPEDVPAFLDHLWAFDRPTVTDEDRQRTRMYQIDRRRQDFRREAVSFASFIAGLDLRVDVRPLDAAHAARASQLSQRTTQFNTTGVQVSEAEVLAAVRHGLAGWVAEVRDRFGEYGLVAVVLADRAGDRLVLRNMLMSCRVLGRGVEHAVLAEVGRQAGQLGVATVEIAWRATPRNEPARLFLAQALAEFAVPAGDPAGDPADTGASGATTGRYLVPVDRLAGVAFRPAQSPDPVPSAQVRERPARDRLRRLPGTALETIAGTLNDTSTIDARIRGRAPESPAEAAPVDADTDLYAVALRVVRGVLAGVLSVPASQIHADSTFDALRVTSFMVVDATVELERQLGRLPRTLLYEHRDVAGVAEFLANECRAALARLAGPRAVTRSVADGAVTGGAVAARERSGAAPVGDEPHGQQIAIVGVAGRYPGAADPAEFWELLANGRSAVGEVRADRWDHDRYYHPDRDRADKTYSKWAAMLPDIDRFDPLFFNIAPAEAELIDPQQRLFLEVAYEAMQDAGHTRRSLGRDVGVYVGAMARDYGVLSAAGALTGTSPYPYAESYQIANRVSYFLDFMGPSLTVDTACSSSLVAVHLACEALCGGAVSAAIAGGVNLLAHPSRYIQYARMGMLSPTGACRAFAADADGIVLGEGAGAVLLKPLARAVEDGDHIYGVIRGTAMNSGGRTHGFTVPNPAAQAALVRRALDRAGLSASALDYVEAHGTGTPLGDPIEMRGLAAAFADAQPPPPGWAVGSVKTNIGHLEAAAGIAGLTKVLLQLRHGAIAPLLHAARPNPHIEFGTGRFRLPQRLEQWPRGASKAPRRAGVSAFGAGGVNAHVVIEEYVAPDRQADGVGGGGVGDGRPDGRPELFVLSARSPSALAAYAGRLRAHLGGSSDSVTDVAHTLRHGREAFGHRAAFLARDRAEARDALSAIADGRAIDRPGAWSGSPRQDGDGRPAAVGVRDGVAAGEFDLAELGRAWCDGADIQWPQAIAARGRRVPLPTYPFERRRYWLRPERAEAVHANGAGAQPPNGSCAQPPHGAGAQPPRPPVPVVGYDDELAAALGSRVREVAAEVINAADDELDGDVRFLDSGFNSVLLAKLASELNKEFGFDLTVVTLYENPTVRELTTHLVGHERASVVTRLSSGKAG